MNKDELNERINELWAETKAGNLPRDERFKAIEVLTGEYVESTGERPEPAQLDRLADLCLHEELTDKRKNKMTVNEYPFMNERMSDERKARDVKASASEREQERKLTGIRRKRSPYEHAMIDRKAKARNAERHRKYREFTKVQPVTVYKI